MTEKVKESPEVFERLNVSIKEPQLDKHFMVGFAISIHDQKYTERQYDAYSYAILHILEEAGLSPFHQIGAHERKGMQAWEIWSETEKDYLEEKIIPLIHEAAEEYDHEMEAMRVSDRVDEVLG